MKHLLENEVWKPFPLFDLYEVSNLGRVRRASTGFVRSSRVTKGGYLQLCLSDGKRREMWMVHRMVAIAFHGSQPSETHQVGHSNGKPGDNRAENLRWLTPKENCADRIAHGRNPHGQGNGKAKIADAVIPSIHRDRKSGLTQDAIADRYGISQAQVWNILHHKQRVREYGDTSVVVSA